MANGWDFLQQSAQNDLFSTQDQRDSERIGQLREEYLANLMPFKGHTFKVKDDAKMEDLKNSIETNGLLQPIMCFYNEEGNIEIISGHRRKRACELLGIDTVPIFIKNTTRDDAIIAMGETNLQTREEILPSEKAFTYAAMLDAMTRQGKRTDLTSVPVEQKLTSRKRLAEKVSESDAQIQRYIRLTKLIAPLLNLVDEKHIGFRPAVELSYLPTNLQECINNIYDSCQVTPSHAQAIKMRELLKEGLLDEATIDEIMMEEKPNQKEALKLSDTFIKKYLGGCSTKLEMENRIAKALELLDRQEKIGGKTAEAEYER